MNFTDDSQMNTKLELNVVSLIDVVFLMLIFFMITTSFVAQPGLKIKLPTAKTGPISTPDKIILTISKDESLYLDNTPTSTIELKKKLLEKIKKNPNSTMVVKADEKVYHGTVVWAMDIAKSVGINNLAIATQPADMRHKIDKTKGKK